MKRNSFAPRCHFLVFPRVVMIKKKKKSELNRVFLMRIFEKAVIKRKTGPTVLETLWTSLHSGTEQCCESSALIAFYRQVNTGSEK